MGLTLNPGVLQEETDMTWGDLDLFYLLIKFFSVLQVSLTGLGAAASVAWLPWLTT